MYQRTTIIKNPTGLHARPASDFIRATSAFEAKIYIKRASDIDGEEEGNAKSIVNLLALGLCKGEEIAITAKGEDEVEAVDTLIALIDAGFGEC